MSFALSSFIVIVFLGLAIRQASFILIHGSIFGGFRNWIERGMRQKRFGFTKLSELFTCKLCMTAQVAIWMVGVPGTLLSYRFGAVQKFFGESVGIGLEVVILILSWFIVSMGLAAVAMSLWAFIEYPSNRYHGLQDRFRRLKERFELLLAENENFRTQGQDVSWGEVFGFVDFQALLESLDSCRRHGCGFDRRECRQERMRKFLRLWWARNHNGRPESVHISLRIRLAEALVHYFGDVGVREDVHRHRVETYCAMIGQPGA